MKRLILGCGYLGIPTGRRWLQAGDQVVAVTRTRKRFVELQKLGFSPRIGDITRPSTLNNLPLADTVLFAVGLDRTQTSDIRSVYVDGLKNVLERLPTGTKHFIYISTTSVYGKVNSQWVNEDTPVHPIREGGKACLEAEQLLQASHLGDAATILRFSGIYGPNRIPFQSVILSTDRSRLSPDGHLNLIHVEDGARVIDHVSNKTPLKETFLVSDGHPVERREFYDTVAKHLQADPIAWPTPSDTRRSDRGSKKIDNQKLCRLLGDFRFNYPDYKTGLVGCWLKR